MKQKSGLKRSLSPFQSFSSGIIIKAKSIVAAGLVYVEVFVVSFSQEFIVDVDRFPEWERVYLYSPMWK